MSVKNSDNQSILEDRLVFRRAEDTAKLCRKHYEPKSYGFLTPHEIAVIKKNVIADNDTKAFFYGGYEDAERCLYIVMPEFCDIDYSKHIALLKISGRDISSIGHRDVLGSLMSLGITRENVGDIIIKSDMCEVFVRPKIVTFIVENLKKIKHTGVTVEQIRLCEFENSPKNLEEIRITVSGLRLDGVLSAVLKLSRSKAQEFIAHEKVSLNYFVQTNASKTVKPNDVISCMGYGKFIIKSNDGISKKGRHILVIERYI